jgi:GWxTD domain-containing protein
VKKAALLLGIFCFILIWPIFVFAQTKKSLKDLDPHHRRWLEDEVAYIITPKEKDVFLQLETSRQRDIFIEAFWKQRDPTPGTPENEFKIEHYRRINYANQNLGKDSPGPGSRSDMGRIYIILGEPNAIDKYENLPDMHPVIVWFYSGMIEYGLPNSFSVVFFRRDSIHPYELYSPIKYGPQYLLVNYRGDMTDYQQAYDLLFDIEPRVASISLSLIEGERLLQIGPSIASEILLNQSIPTAPYEKVKDSYAEKLMAYKDIIEVEYTANYIENDSLVRVFQDPSGLFFVHYLIEPKRLTFEQYDTRFLSNLEIDGRVVDTEGNSVYQFNRSVPIEMNKEQISAIRSKLFSFQDMFPLIGGRYKLNILLKNVASKEFTSVEVDISVPEAPSFEMSPLVLAERIGRESKFKGQNKPFLIENYQLVPTPRNDFTAQDTLYVYFQVRGLTQELKDNGNLEFSIFKGNEKVHSVSRSLKEYTDQLNFLEEFPLAILPPANYTIRVSLLDGNQATVLSEKAIFFISHRAVLPRPWVLSLPLPPDNDPEMIHALGVQFLNKKNIGKARDLLEQAFRGNPASPLFAMDYCRVLFTVKDYQTIKQVALPLLKDQDHHEFLQVLGRASHALGELEEAIAYYKDYLTRFGTNILVLNAIGDCYYKMGKKEEALVAWERSLEINPKQADIKALVKSLKEQK